MKHIKTYKIFESASLLAIDSRVEDFKDCFIDLKHDNFEVDFTPYDLSGSHPYIEVEIQNKMVENRGNIFGNNLPAGLWSHVSPMFYIDDVKDVIDFATSYGKSININPAFIEAIDEDEQEYTWEPTDIDMVEYFTRYREDQKGAFINRDAFSNDPLDVAKSPEKIKLQWIRLVCNLY